MFTLDASIREFLRERRYAVWATHDQDGSIHQTPVYYLFENEQFFIPTHSATRKARNLIERPNGSLLIESRKPGADRWVSAAGPIEMITGEQSTAVNARIFERYLSQEALSNSKIEAFIARDDVTLCLRPDKWRSWDLGAIDKQQFAGQLGQMQDRWFLPHA